MKFGIEYLIDLIPIMKARSFSISSCEKGKMGLTVAVVEYTTKIKGVRRGVCTRWMKGLTIGGNQYFFVSDDIFFRFG